MSEYDYVIVFDEFGTKYRLISENAHIYVVLEHHKKGQDAILHGVYHCRAWAESKKKQIERKYSKTKKKPGYICILRKSIR